MTGKLDWADDLMLDDGKGTGVDVIEGPDCEGDYRVQVHARSRLYSSGGTPYNPSLPRIINRPKPDAEPVAIIPDTPLDRFTASHPNWRDLDKEEAVRLALEQRGEG